VVGYGVYLYTLYLGLANSPVHVCVLRGPFSSTCVPCWWWPLTVSIARTSGMHAHTHTQLKTRPHTYLHTLTGKITLRQTRARALTHTHTYTRV